MKRPNKKFNDARSSLGRANAPVNLALGLKMSREILSVIEQAIEAGESSSQKIYDHFQTLDEALGVDLVSGNVRSFFDSWSDAIGHDYMPYEEKRIEEWVSAAEEIKQHYLHGKSLSSRKIWQECAVKNA